MTEENELPPTHKTSDGKHAVRVTGLENISGLGDNATKTVFVDRDGNQYSLPSEVFETVYVKITE